uniref:uncharacterized protein LOC120820964 isoform X2 n=1 Tax=Gasterosteus aculeatus aculeatus TaxID=481459 RepID=UPI001A99CBF0|nr:uncharacterized protein LOC120820964 isoform X2 [Gasterosteus aculeatus aculeatus]XP_040045388.1 uncharacterized protein LOC120826870 isoform X2 [Gasterosteus aculeatus aculeatus]
MEGSEAPKTLTTVFLDGTEICKKMLQLPSIADILDACKSSLTCNAECDRLLKFNTDFNEYIDTDINGNVGNLDKYHILFKSTKPKHSREQLAEPPGTDAAGPSGQLEAEQFSSCTTHPSSQLNSRGQIDGAHGFNAASLTALLESKARSVLAEYEKSGTLSVTSRKLIVKIGVSDLVERRGFYPSSADKQNLAKSLITVFPSLKIKIQEENEGFEHFYDPVSHCGFIEMKLRNLRRTLHDDQRLYRKRGRSSNPSGVSITLEVIADGEEESIKEWITSTKRMRPSPENIASIKMGMEKTYTNRRLWITSKSPTVAEVFQQYPRFVDMPYLTGTSIPSLLEGSPEEAVGVHQPKLVCLGHPRTVAQYVIIAKNDNVAIPLQDEGLTCAIDKLFKVFWVCNMAYPAQLESVYSFFEYVYDMPISGGKRSKVVELIAKLQAVLL